MTKANTQVIAKVAAIVAGAGLVLSSFAYAIPAGAQTTTTTTTTTTSATFTRDLTIGSTGADVTTLQNWLISKGFSIPAGATGYFGAQTQAALAAYQAANGITPAAGYFGPITRAKVNAGGPVSGGDDDDDDDDDDSDNGDLEGGEADLSDFELRRETSIADSNEADVEVFTAEFDVEDGDVRVERMEVMASSTGTGSASTRPWDYFDSVTLMDADGDEIAEMDVDDRDAWDEDDDDIYRLSISDLDYVVREDERAEITAAFDIGDLDDSDVADGEFTFYVEDEGIRSRDAEGVDQYIGDEDEEVSLSFGDEESGDLRIRSNDDDPDTMTLISDEDDESEDYTVFVFDIENEDDAAAEITDLTIDVAAGSSTLPLDEVIRRATLMVDGDEFDADISSAAGNGTLEFDDIDVEVGEDDSMTFELVISIARDAGNTTLEFSLDEDKVEAEGVESGDDSEVGGSATSEEHTVAQEGVVATAEEADNRSSNEADSTVNDNGVGTFRITFSVEAIEEDAYIYRGAGLGDNDSNPFNGGIASTTGFAYNIIQGSTASSTAPNSATVQSGADTEGNYYVIREGDSEEFTITITVDTPVSGSYFAELDAIRFDDIAGGAGTSDDTVYLVPDDVEFESEALSLF